MAVVTITKENFEAEVLHSAKPVLLDFWATWCGPCRMLSPIVDEVAEERTDVKVGKVNVRRDEHPHPAGVPRRQACESGCGCPPQGRCAGASGLKDKKSSCMAAACFRMGGGLFALDNMAYLPYTERGKV